MSIYKKNIHNNIITLNFLQTSMNVQLTKMNAVNNATTLLDHFIVSVIRDMHCLMMEEHVEI